MFWFWKRSVAKKVTVEELKHALKLIGPVSGNADKGIDRGIKLLSEEYGNDLEKLKSIVYRITALFGFIEDTMTLAGGEKEFPKGIQFHEAVLEAAAGHPVGRDGNFEENSFLDLVRAIRRKKYGDDPLNRK